MSYNERFKAACATKVGDVWTNRKTGKKATIIVKHAGYGTTHLRHESGRETCKDVDYLASDFNPPAN